MVDTVLPADSLEFCPSSGFHDIFVCGTYKIDDQISAEQESLLPRTRRGQCLVFKVLLDSEGQPQQIQSFDLPAILDMKWHGIQVLFWSVVLKENSNRCHTSAPSPLLAIADSEGSITLHQLREQSLSQLCSIRCAPSDTLCLSLDWSNRKAGGTDLGSLIVSLSNGNLCLLKPSKDSNVEVAETWHAHDYEPWIAAWNYWDPNIIYSGGDDLKMKAWDIRQGFAQPIFVNKKFEAGVTSIQNHPHLEHLLAVGSYNNSVQLFDVRKPLTPLAQASVGGGAWRVKWHPAEDRKNDLLVACMHDGFKIIRFGDDFSGDPQTAKRYDEHKSLAYGVDWSYAQPSSNGETLIGSCSFYDHKMDLWLG
ncbi:WD40 repeat-like protein [Phlegmacium glaucopus]|nr:WD40 repeat-like protein [Phlegmacium glaucopus]